MEFQWAWAVVYCGVGRCIVSWSCSQVHMCHLLKWVFRLPHKLCWLGQATCVEGLTYSGKVLCDHTQCYAGLPAQEEFV